MVLGMKTDEKGETPHIATEEIIGSMGCPSFDPLSSYIFPFPDLLGDDNLLRENYESPREMVPRQAHQSYYLHPLTQLANESSQTVQSRFHQSFHQQTTSRKIINLNYGTSPANAGISLFTDCHNQHNKREDTLISKATVAELSCNRTRMEGNPIASWGQRTRSETRASYHSPSSRTWSGTLNNSSQSGGGACGKQRIRWTHELHEQFVDAVNSLGGSMKATPKGILTLMKTPGLTIVHIKSHLQKYRTTKDTTSFHKGGSGRSNCAGMPLPNLKGNGGLQISETLRLQMNVQKSLHDHLEFQKNLQMRIEKQTNYLEHVIHQKKKSCSFFQNDTSDKALDLYGGESSSIRVHEGLGQTFLNENRP